MPNTIELIFGGASIDTRYGFDDPAKRERFLDAIATLGISSIDTALIYGDSEELLGHAKAALRFAIDTKFPGGFAPNTATRVGVLQYAQNSLKRLNTNIIDIYYQHAPDPQIPLGETLAGVNELYEKGVFKRFGISNFNAADVEEVVRICKEMQYVLPTVYQGNYNAFARHVENTILPTLRKHGIKFYAYSTSAGGFLAKTSEQLRQGGTGRWAMDNAYGKVYNGLYGKPSLLRGLDDWNNIAQQEGITGIEMAYRWIMQHSRLEPDCGDAVVVGGRSVEQLRENIAWMKKGPLSSSAVEQIECIWASIASDAPLDNYNSISM